MSVAVLDQGLPLRERQRRDWTFDDFSPRRNGKIEADEAERAEGPMGESAEREHEVRKMRKGRWAGEGNCLVQESIRGHVLVSERATWMGCGRCDKASTKSRKLSGSRPVAICIQERESKRADTSRG